MLHHTSALHLNEISRLIQGEEEKKVSFTDSLVPQYDWLSERSYNIR